MLKSQVLEGTLGGTPRGVIVAKGASQLWGSNVCPVHRAYILALNTSLAQGCLANKPCVSQKRATWQNFSQSGGWPPSLPMPVAPFLLLASSGSCGPWVFPVQQNATSSQHLGVLSQCTSPRGRTHPRPYLTWTHLQRLQFLDQPTPQGPRGQTHPSLLEGHSSFSSWHFITFRSQPEIYRLSELLSSDMSALHIRRDPTPRYLSL